METSVIVGVALVAFVTGNLSGWYGAKTWTWWRKAAMSMRHVKPLLRVGGAAVVALAVLGAVFLRATGALG